MKRRLGSATSGNRVSWSEEDEIRFFVKDVKVSKIRKGITKFLNNVRMLLGLEGLDDDTEVSDQSSSIVEQMNKMSTFQISSSWKTDSAQAVGQIFG